MFNPNYEELIGSWNNTLALIAKIVDVPVALVMKLENKSIKVFSRNEHEDNPYNIGDSEILSNSGLYCEHVVSHQEMLHVPNALEDPLWNTNPDLKLDMIAYLGLPILDGDENPFGTVCLLDKQAHTFSDTTIELLTSVKKNFEAQLKLLKQQHVDDQRTQYQEFTTLIRGIAHEMNTPLGVGITAASVLENKLKELSQSISSNTLTKQLLLDNVAAMCDTVTLMSGNMTTAANKLSNLQDITVNDYEVHAGSYQLDNLVNEAFTLYEHELRLGSVNYSVASEDNIDIQLSITAQMFHKVLLILFKNSIEHGFKKQQQHEITITIKDGVDCLIVNYHDNGVGLAQECLDIIFTPYYTSNVMSDSSGLGLAIAKRIITQQLGGEISAMACDSGAHFNIRLPKNKN